MGRTLGIEQIKTVLDFIRQDPEDWKELKDLKTLRVRNKPIGDKALGRILEYLTFWGLVFKDDDGKWSWFLRKQVFENRDVYGLALKHSKWLVFGGERLGHDGAHQGISASMNTLEDFAFPDRQRTDYQEHQAFFDHIKTGYPPAYQKLKQYAELFHRQRELMKPTIEKEPSINILGSLEYDVERTFYTQGYPEFGFQKEENLEEKSRLERLHKAFTEKELERLNLITKEKMRIAEDAVSQLSVIRFKLEQGVPLKGYCQACPHLQVSIKQ